MKFNQEKVFTSRRFVTKYLSASQYNVFPKNLFSEADNLYEQKQNWLLPKTEKKTCSFFFPIFKKLIIGFFVA